MRWKQIGWKNTDHGPGPSQAGGGAIASPGFGQTVNPISTKRTDYAHRITMSPPNFQTLRRPCGL